MMTSTERLTITAVIPAYNAERYIRRAINSVLTQTRPADEIIVVDDGSTDNTVAIVRSYGDRLRLFKQSNSGVSSARNTGINASACNWIAFLDADDEWLPNKLEIQTEILKKNPGIVWIGANYYCQDEVTNRCMSECRSPAIQKFLDGKDHLDYFAAYSHEIWAHTSNYLIKKAVLLEAGLFEPGLNLLEDMDLWWKIAYRHPRLGYAAQPLSCYHFTIKPHGLTRTERPVENYTKITDRHLALSQSYGQSEGFRKVISVLLQAWIRRMLFENRPADIKLLLKRYADLLDKRFQLIIRTLMFCPKCTAQVCLLISCVVRLTGLRKKVVPRHPHMNKARSD